MFRRRRRRGPEPGAAPTDAPAPQSAPEEPTAPAESAPQPGGSGSSGEAGLGERVQAYQEQAMLAARLAETPDTDFATATSNPRVLEHLLHRRDGVHRRVIDADAQRAVLRAELEHTRLARSIDDEDRWARAGAARRDRAIRRAETEAEQAERDVAAITEALEATRPASAATRLARTQEAVVRGYLGFALAGSLMSAIGIAHAVAYGTTAGWAVAIAMAAIVEIPSTTLATFVIWTQGLLHRNDRSAATTREADGTRVRLEAMGHLSQRVRTGPWSAVTFLLAVSVAINAWGALLVDTGLFGVLGMVGAVIAALASLLGWGYSLQSSAVITANMASPGVADALAERRRVASGADIPTASRPDTPQPQPQTASQNEDAPAIETLLEEITQHLNTSPEPEEQNRGGLATLSPSFAPTDQEEHPAPTEGEGDSSAPGEQDKHPRADQKPEPGSPAPTDQDKHPEGDSTSSAAIERARQARSAHTRARRHQALALWQQGLCAGEIALRLERDLRTVTGYLTEEGLSSLDLGERTRARMLDLIDEHGPGVPTRDLARRLGIGRTAARQHREALAQRGHHVTNPDQ